MTEARLLTQLFARFGVGLTEHEAAVAADYPPRDALMMLLADREVSARFDAAHGRPPNDDDVDELLDIYFALAAKGG